MEQTWRWCGQCRDSSLPQALDSQWPRPALSLRKPRCLSRSLRASWQLLLQQPGQFQSCPTTKYKWKHYCKKVRGQEYKKSQVITGQIVQILSLMIDKGRNISVRNCKRTSIYLYYTHSCNKTYLNSTLPNTLNVAVISKI